MFESCSGNIFQPFHWKFSCPNNEVWDKKHAKSKNPKTETQIPTNDCQTSFEGLRTAKDEWFQFEVRVRDEVWALLLLLLVVLLLLLLLFVALSVERLTCPKAMLPTFEKKK